LVVSISKEGPIVGAWVIWHTIWVWEWFLAPHEGNTFSFNTLVQRDELGHQNEEEHEWSLLSDEGNVLDRLWTFDDTEEADEPGDNVTGVESPCNLGRVSKLVWFT